MITVALVIHLRCRVQVPRLVSTVNRLVLFCFFEKKKYIFNLNYEVLLTPLT